MRVQSFIIDHFTLVLMGHFFMANLQGYICVWKNYIVIFHTITLEIMHSHPRHHIHAIISSVVITDWPCVATYQMYFVWSARRCLNPHWLRAAQSHFGTAPAPGHVRQVNNLVTNFSCAHLSVILEFICLVANNTRNKHQKNPLVSA